MKGWYTSHVHSEKVMKHVQTGWKIPVCHTDRFSKKGAEHEEAIMYGILRGCADVIHHHFKNGIDYLHIDNGYFKRHHYSGYYRVSLNDTQARYKDIALPSERAKKLDVKIRDWVRNENGYVLIIPHTPAFEIFYGVDIKKWTDTTIKKLNGRPYKIRDKNATTPLEEDLKSASCVITFNSNAALEAILAGIPAIATSNHSVIKSWNKLTMDNVEDCFDKCSALDREKLVNFLSYHQFTLDEIDKGIAPAIIKEMRKENVY